MSALRMLVECDPCSSYFTYPTPLYLLAELQSRASIRKDGKPSIPRICTVRPSSWLETQSSPTTRCSTATHCLAQGLYKADRSQPSISTLASPVSSRQTAGRWQRMGMTYRCGGPHWRKLQVYFSGPRHVLRRPRASHSACETTTCRVSV